MSGLFERPTASRSQLEDGHPFCGWIMGATVWIDSRHTCVFDADFFAEQGNFLVGVFQLGSQTDPAVEAIDTAQLRV